MENFTPFASAMGGVLIGLAAVAMLALNGRIAGISGILGELVERPQPRSWRGSFVLGMAIGAIFVRILWPTALPGVPVAPLWLLAIAGVLIGFGTRVGGGCTSGHGVCGISRLSTRSLAATVIFMATASLTTYVVRHVLDIGVTP